MNKREFLKLCSGSVAGFQFGLLPVINRKPMAEVIDEYDGVPIIDAPTSIVTASELMKDASDLCALTIGSAKTGGHRLKAIITSLEWYKNVPVEPIEYLDGHTYHIPDLYNPGTFTMQLKPVGLIEKI